MNGDITATKLSEELALRETSRARSLTERGLFGNKKTDGQVQSSITDRDALVQRLRQRQFHAGNLDHTRGRGKAAKPLAPNLDRNCAQPQLSETSSLNALPEGRVPQTLRAPRHKIRLTNGGGRVAPIGTATIKATASQPLDPTEAGLLETVVDANRQSVDRRVEKP